MTINLADNTPRIVYTVAEGVSQTTFSVPFEFFDSSDLNVYADNVLQVEGTDYAVIGGDGATGSIEFASFTGGTGGSSVLIYRRVQVERTSDFSSGAEISRPTLNEQLDALTAMMADVNDRVDRSVRSPDPDLLDGSMELPDISTRAGKYFAFGVDGAPTMTSGTTSDIVVSSFAETLIDDDNATEFLATLGITATPTQINNLVGYSFSDVAFYDEATTANYIAAAADKVLTADQVWDAGAVQTLTDGAIISPDFSAGINFEVTLGGNRTLGNPTNLKVGQTGFIRVNQDATGSRTLGFDSSYVFQSGVSVTISSAANASDLLFYSVISSTEVLINLVAGVS